MHIHIPYTWAMDGKFIYNLYISGFHRELWRMIINEQVITYTYTCRVVHSTAVRRYRLSDARVGWTASYRHPLRFSPRRYLDFRITSPSSLSTSCSSYHCLTHRCLNMILWCYAQHLVIRVSISKRQCHRWPRPQCFRAGCLPVTSFPYSSWCVAHARIC